MSAFEQPSPETKKENVCQFCGKIFKRVKDLKSHCVIHSDIKPFVCNLCPEAFKHKASLKRHSLIHSGEKPFDCKLCGKSFRQKGSLNEHLLTHTGEKPHTCEICFMGFTTRSNYLRHVKKHLNSRPYPCAVCGKSFNVDSALKRHYKLHVKLGHILSLPADIDNVDIYDTDDVEKERLCTENAMKMLIVDEEIEEGEESDKMYPCKICKKKFHGLNYLKSHLLSHMSKKLYKCSLCSDTFNSISDFCKHKLTHSQVSDSKIVKICKDSYDKIDAIQKHLKVKVCSFSKSYNKRGTENTNPKKCFICSICCQSFEKEFVYIEHFFEHKITGPFECDICYDKRIFENLIELHEHYSRHDEIPCVCFICNSSVTDLIVSAQNMDSECSLHKCSLCHKCFIDTALLQKHFAMHKSRRPYLVKLET